MNKPLKKAFERLKKLPFPEAFNDSGASDWIAELAEMDGFYAGLAVTILQGKPLKIKNLPSLDLLREGLEKLSDERKIHQSDLRKYKAYLKALDTLAKHIQRFIQKEHFVKIH